MKKTNDRGQTTKGGLAQTLLALLAVCSVSAAADFDSTGYQWVSYVEVGEHSGFVRLVLPAEALDKAQPNLADVRLQDEEAELVPYVLRTERTEDVERSTWREVSLINETFLPSEFARVTLDFGDEAIQKNQIQVALSGDNYRRKAVLESSCDGQTWEVVVPEQWLFSMRQRDEEFRLNTISFPINDQRYLRLTIHNMTDDPERIRIEKVEAALTETLSKAALVDVPVTSMVGPAGRKGTHYHYYSIDLGYRHLPVAQIELNAYHDYFYRGYELWGRNAETEEVVRPYESGSRKITQEVAWNFVSRGILYRIKEDETVKVNATIAAIHAPYRYLELRTFDEDNRPLKIDGAKVSRREVSLVFEAQAGAKYWLWFGNPSATAPNFDLARAVPDLQEKDLPRAHVWKPSQVVEAPTLAPWTERHRVLLWVVLVLVVAAVLTMILQSLKNPQPKG